MIHADCKFRLCHADVLSFRGHLVPTRERLHLSSENGLIERNHEMMSQPQPKTGARQLYPRHHTKDSTQQQDTTITTFSYQTASIESSSGPSKLTPSFILSVEGLLRKTNIFAIFDIVDVFLYSRKLHPTSWRVNSKGHIGSGYNIVGHRLGADLIMLSLDDALIQECDRTPKDSRQQSSGDTGKCME